MATCLRRLKANGEFGKQFELASDEWDLDFQLSLSMKWIDENAKKLNNGRWILDIGFCMRKNVAISGYTINCSAMKKLSRLKIDLWLSHYPGKC